MSAKYIFNLKSEDRRRDLPGKIILVQQEAETVAHVLLKLLGFVLFFRERLQVEPHLHLNHIPFVPDLVQLDYTLTPVLWVECGECTVAKLDRLAVKVPEAEIWAVRRSRDEADQLHAAMTKAVLRRGRYGLLALEAAMFDEMLGIVAGRNDLFWVTGEFDPPHVQFDFNGLWFDAGFTVLRF